MPPAAVNTIRILVVIAFGTTNIATAQIADTAWASVHGHRIHLLVSKGVGPTVVLEAGAGSTHRTWQRLREQLDPSIRVVAYDRPGFGRSESCPSARDATTIARELKAALASAGIAPPYLLVGWSAGGLYSRVFAAMHPGDVVGLVLLDPAPETFYARAERAFPEVFRRLNAVDSTGIHSGPPVEQQEDAGWDATLVQARSSDVTLRAPTILLSAPRPDLEVLAPLWHAEQRAWATRQRNAVFRIVARSGHAIHRDRADTVATVIQNALTRLTKKG